MSALPASAMIDVYCDESHDDHTYALAGWIGTPIGWDHFCPAWRQMLLENSAPSFHAAEVVNRDEISNSRFKGWTFDQEKRLFKSAIDVIADRRNIGLMWPIGVSVTLSGNRQWIATPDTAWKLLFLRLFMVVFQECGPQNGISFMFDEKDGVKRFVDRFYLPAKETINAMWPGKIHGASVAFADDEEEGFEPLQAADLFAYEWRRRSSEKRMQPDKRTRTAYTRLREARQENAKLHHYDAAAVDQIMAKIAAGQHFVNAMMSTPSTED